MTLLPRSLFGRLALVQIAFGIVVALLLAVVTGLTHDRFHHETSQRQGIAWAGKILDEHRQALVAAMPNRSRLTALLATMERSNPAARFYVVGSDGEILGAAVPLTALSRRQIATLPMTTLLDGSARLPVLVDDPLEAEGGKIFSVAAFATRELPNAYFLMVQRMPKGQSYLATHANYLLTDSLLLATGVTAPALAASVILFFMILRPIRRLSTVIETLEERTITAPPAPFQVAPNIFEIDELGRHFERMAGRVSDLVQRQREEDRQRREMFANLSHDLRTPLAIIDACLETLRDDRYPLAPSETAHLLAAAAARSHALKRLVESIFELATLENADYPLRCETFPIGEMIDEIAAKFPTLAGYLNCAIVVDIAAADRPCRVCADPFLIGRVLDNLIDNALCHATGATRIIVGMHRQGGAVEISVCDDGCGLPADVRESLAAISGGSSPWRTAGRGLRIVQRILHLHHSTLTATAGEVAGTRFAFSLPLTAPFPASEGALAPAQ